MKRLILLFVALFGFAAAPAVAQGRVAVAVSIGVPHVAAYVTLGRPHIHRASTLIVVGAPRAHGRAILLTRYAHRHRARFHDPHGPAHGYGTCGGGHGCR